MSKEKMTAREFFKREYSEHNSMAHYPPSEQRITEIMQAYAEHSNQETTSEEGIKTCVANNCENEVHSPAIDEIFCDVCFLKAMTPTLSGESQVKDGDVIKSVINCPTCGTECKVGGEGETHYYIPLTQDGLREAATYYKVWQKWCESETIKEFDAWLHERLIN